MPQLPVPAHLSAYILLDRSGSMSSRWADALGGLNTYVAKLVEEGQGEAEVTLAVFDQNGVGALDFHILREHEKARACKPVTSIEAYPRGGTPLFDACIRLTALAEESNAARAVLIIITDGEENASKEATKETAKAALDRARERGWEVLFMGVDFDAFHEARGLGNANYKNINTSSATFGATMRRAAVKSASYAVSGQDIAWTPEEQAEALKKD